jgi:hypothetical protein
LPLAPCDRTYDADPSRHGRNQTILNSPKKSGLIEVARTFNLTVLDPNGKALPRVPVEIRCEAAIDAARVREGKFLRPREADTVPRIFPA